MKNKGPSKPDAIDNEENDSYSQEINDLLSKGIEYFNKNNFDKAIECFKNILKIDPKNVDALIELGNSYAYLKNYNGAIESFKKVIEL
ncbi:MAG TPA: tetratricopeptide repeat protein, partial [Candidatus Lokiarchaeia archaeon]